MLNDEVYDGIDEQDCTDENQYYDDDEDEYGGYPKDYYFALATDDCFEGYSSPVVAVCPKKYWDEEHFIYDGECGIYETLYKLGFGDDMEGYFSSFEGPCVNMSAEEVVSFLTSKGFEYNKDLEGAD